MKYLVLAFLVVGIAIGAYVGCGPRVGVAKDKAIEQIDKLLGPLNVAQKDVEQKYDELKKASSEVRNKRIEAEVRLKALNAKQSDLEKNKAKIVADLSKLKDMLSEAESSGSVKRGDKEISVEQLKSLADQTARRFRSVKDSLTKNNVITAAWTKNLSVLKKQDDTSADQLKKLENQLDEIRSKKSALDAMKEAASIAGPSTSISDKFDELTKGVDELLVNIDTEFAIEEAKIDERMAEMQEASDLTLDELLDDQTDVSSTISELDEILNSEKNEGGK